MTLINDDPNGDAIIHDDNDNDDTITAADSQLEDDLDDPLDIESEGSPCLISKPTLQYYYELVARESLTLSKPEQEVLLIKYHDSTSSATEKADCVDKLCRANLKLVYKIAKGYAYDDDSLLNYIGAGNEGLLKAIHKYQFGKAPFPNYAPVWIKQRILNELYSNNLLKVPLWRIKTFIKIKLSVKDLIAKNGNDPTDSEIAALTGISERNVDDLRNDAYLSKILDRAATDDEFPIYNIFDESMVQFSQLHDSSQLSTMEQINVRDILNSALEYLTVEQRTIIKAYYGFLDGNCKKLHQLATFLDRTPERVRQVRNTSLKRLRELLVSSGVSIDDWD